MPRRATYRTLVGHTTAYLCCTSGLVCLILPRGLGPAPAQLFRAWTFTLPTDYVAAVPLPAVRFPRLVQPVTCHSSPVQDAAPRVYELDGGSAYHGPDPWTAAATPPPIQRFVPRAALQRQFC